MDQDYSIIGCSVVCLYNSDQNNIWKARLIFLIISYCPGCCPSRLQLLFNIYITFLAPRLPLFLLVRREEDATFPRWLNERNFPITTGFIFRLKGNNLGSSMLYKLEIKLNPSIKCTLLGDDRNRIQQYLFCTMPLGLMVRSYERTITPSGIVHLNNIVFHTAAVTASHSSTLWCRNKWWGIPYCFVQNCVSGSC